MVQKDFFCRAWIFISSEQRYSKKLVSSYHKAEYISKGFIVVFIPVSPQDKKYSCLSSPTLVFVLMIMSCGKIPIVLFPHVPTWNMLLLIVKKNKGAE